MSSFQSKIRYTKEHESMADTHGKKQLIKVIREEAQTLN